MTISFEVVGIIPDGNDRDRHIDMIKAVHDGSTNLLHIDTAIALQQSGDCSFYTLQDGQRAKVTVAHLKGKPHLRTEADGFGPNNLHSLAHALDPSSDRPKGGLFGRGTNPGGIFTFGGKS